MIAFQFFSIKSVQDENAISFLKTSYHVTADDITVTF